MTVQSPQLACNMNAFNRTERDRYKVLTDKLSASAAAELSAGYEIVVALESLSLVELAEWISLESRCCPFLNFAVALRLTGATGVKEFLAAELGFHGD